MYMYMYMCYVHVYMDTSRNFTTSMKINTHMYVYANAYDDLSMTTGLLRYNTTHTGA